MSVTVGKKLPESGSIAKTLSTSKYCGTISSNGCQNGCDGGWPNFVAN